MLFYKPLSAAVLLLVLIIATHSCTSQPEKQYHNKTFNWRITLPAGFTAVSDAEVRRLQQKGRDAVEKTLNATVENEANTFLMLKHGDLNYFEANSQPYDSATDGPYTEMCAGVNAVLYQTFAAQIPDATVDSSSGIQTVDGLDFRTFRVVLSHEGKPVVHCMLYSRPLKGREFSVNICWHDEAQGNALTDAWLGSKFH